jgi:hypothetical protein
LARREESELFAYLLTDPTPSMMRSVNLVSREILKTIERMKTEDSELLESFLEELEESAHFIACGAFNETPSVCDIEQILQNNDPKQLAEIMHIHFKFGRSVSRNTPIYAPESAPVGKLTDITKSYPGFFEEIKHKGAEGKRARSYITDALMYDSELYNYIPGKGREGALKNRPSHRLSLMRDSQYEYDIGLPERKNSWVPDCRGQNPNFNSPYVLEVINNDTPYISGPSGMTSVLLGQMEFMANLPDVTLKQNYLTAVASYVVGPGFHCLHEVIGPSQYALNLVPGYNVFTPGKPKSSDEMKLPTSPQYSVFFKQQCSIDAEFSEKRQAAWNRYLDFFQNVYMPKHFPSGRASLSM